jgi:hypothetical protein
MSKEQVLLTFPTATTADANVYAKQLEQVLREAHEDVAVEQSKPDKSTMDFGATLVLVLGAPATVAVARALRAWIQRNNATIMIETPKGKMSVTNADTKDLANIVQALTGEKRG